MIASHFAALAGFLVLSGPLPAPEILPEAMAPAAGALAPELLWQAQGQSGIPFDASFEILGINWRGGGATYLAVAAREYQGRTAICGGYFSEGNVPETVVEQMLRRSTIRAGSKALRSNLNFFTRGTSADDLATKRMRCVATRHAWDAGYPGTLALSAPRRIEY